MRRNSRFNGTPVLINPFPQTNKLRQETRYHQIIAIFQAFLLNFPCSIFLYFFPLEVVQYLSNDRLVSFMGISLFLSLIYHIQNNIYTEKIFISKHKSWQLSGKVLACHAGGRGSIPHQGVQGFFICVISQQYTSMEKSKIPQIPIHKVHL